MNETIVIENQLPSMSTSYIVTPKPIETLPSENGLSSTADLVTAISALAQQDKPSVNLNETVVVDNVLQSVNTSFIVSPKAVETQSNDNDSDSVTPDAPEADLAQQDKPSINLNETVVVDNVLPSVNTSYIVSPNAFETQPNENGSDSAIGLAASMSGFSQQDKPNINLNETVVIDSVLPSVNTSYIVSPNAVESQSNENGFDSAIGLAAPMSEFSQQDKPSFNLNETVVVDNVLPSVNTSYIVSPKAFEMLTNENGSLQMPNEFDDNPFKLPAKPDKTSNPFADLKSKTQNFEVSDDEFQSPGRKFCLFILIFSFICLMLWV